MAPMFSCQAEGAVEGIEKPVTLETCSRRAHSRGVITSDEP